MYLKRMFDSSFVFLPCQQVCILCEDINRILCGKKILTTKNSKCVTKSIKSY